eukprot:gene29594-38716_t
MLNFQVKVDTNAEMISKVQLRKQLCADAATSMPLYIIDVKSHIVFGGSSRLVNSCLYRDSFEKQQHPIKNFYKDELRRDIILISMHIRRGDVVSQDYKNSGRWINNEAYIKLANNLTVMLRELYQNKKKIHVQIFAERSKSIESVLDVGESFTTTDMRKEIMADNVTLGATELLESFSSMCYSDVLVTANSGFSALIFRVCGRPVTFYTGWDFSVGSSDTPDGIPMKLRYLNQTAIANGIGFNSFNFIEMIKKKVLF